MFYYELINIYKKEYEQAFEIKDENWRKKYDCKPLKIFNYEVDKTKKSKIKKKKKVKQKKKKKIKQIKNYYRGQNQKMNLMN